MRHVGPARGGWTLLGAGPTYAHTLPDAPSISRRPPVMPPPQQPACRAHASRGARRAACAAVARRSARSTISASGRCRRRAASSAARIGVTPQRWRPHRTPLRLPDAPIATSRRRRPPRTSGRPRPPEMVHRSVRAGAPRARAQCDVVRPRAPPLRRCESLRRGTSGRRHRVPWCHLIAPTMERICCGVISVMAAASATLHEGPITPPSAPPRNGQLGAGRFGLATSASKVGGRSDLGPSRANPVRAAVIQQPRPRLHRDLHPTGADRTRRSRPPSRRLRRAGPTPAELRWCRCSVVALSARAADPAASPAAWWPPL